MASSPSAGAMPSSCAGGRAISNAPPSRARLPAAAKAGYNGVVFPHDVAPAKAPELVTAAKQNHLDLIPAVMGNAHDRNYTEGVPVNGPQLGERQPGRVLNAPILLDQGQP